MSTSRTFTASLFAVLALAGCNSAQAPVVNEQTTDTTVLPVQTIYLISPAGEAMGITAEIAKTPEQHQQGLMYRDSLNEGNGMLFVFDTQQILSFWMKNTKIPLDILYFDTNRRFLVAKSMDPCVTETCPTYSSETKAQFALEMEQGFAAQYSIGSGWTLRLP